MIVLRSEVIGPFHPRPTIGSFTAAMIRGGSRRDRGNRLILMHYASSVRKQATPHTWSFEATLKRPGQVSSRNVNGQHF